MTPELQFALTVIQTCVGVLTLGGMFYYAGRHSQKLEQHGYDIESLKSARTSIDQHLGTHDVHIAVLARSIDVDLYHHNPS